MISLAFNISVENLKVITMFNFTFDDILHVQIIILIYNFNLKLNWAMKWKVPAEGPIHIEKKRKIGDDDDEKM